MGEGVGQIQKKKFLHRKIVHSGTKEKNKLQASAMKFIGAEICLRHIQILKVWSQNVPHLRPVTEPASSKLNDSPE